MYFVDPLFYLYFLFPGELIGSVAFLENELSPQGIFNTTAKLSANGDCYRIDGKKSFVINGSNANLLLLIAESQSEDRLGDPARAITAFLVDVSTPGIHLEPKDCTLGFKGLAQNSIVFDNCEVPFGEFKRYFIINLSAFSGAELLRGSGNDLHPSNIRWLYTQQFVIEYGLGGCCSKSLYPT